MTSPQPLPLKKERKPRNAKIVIAIGLPGSGKSTWAREYMNDGNVMRVNRDDIRAMLFKRWQGKKEQVVTESEKAIVRNCVSKGYDVVVDDTNLSPSVQGMWENLAHELAVPLVKKDFTDVDISTCIQRDHQRTGKAHIGRAVIEGMALRYGLLPTIPKDQPVVIFDVDGTLADHGDRIKYLQCKPKDYDNYYSPESILACPRIDTVVEWSQKCYYGGYYVLIVSGRPSNLAGDSTELWLAKNGVSYHNLFMRAGDDWRDDTVIKQDILDKLLTWIPKEQFLFAVDDRPRIVEMWRQNGIRCYDVGHGKEF